MKLIIFTIRNIRQDYTNKMFRCGWERKGVETYLSLSYLIVSAVLNIIICLLIFSWPVSARVSPPIKLRKQRQLQTLVIICCLHEDHQQLSSCPQINERPVICPEQTSHNTIWSSALAQLTYSDVNTNTDTDDKWHQKSSTCCSNLKNPYKLCSLSPFECW